MSLKQPERLMLDYLHPMLNACKLLQSMDRVLVLGLGGAAIVKHLLHHYPQCDITAVEINAEVVQLAKQFFRLPASHPKINIHINSAEDFLRQTEQQFDLIFVDLYEIHNLPAFMQQIKFHQHCFEHLSATGICVWNLYSQNLQEFTQVMSSIRHSFQSQTLCLPVKNHSNTVMYGFKNDNYSKTLKQLIDDGKISKLNFDLEFGPCAEICMGN